MKFHMVLLLQSLCAIHAFILKLLTFQAKRLSVSEKNLVKHPAFEPRQFDCRPDVLPGVLPLLAPLLILFYILKMR